MKKLSLFILAIGISFASFAQTKWSVDPMHSFVNFTVKHSGISFVNGSFNKFDGQISTTTADFNDAKVNFTVDVNSVDTHVEMRDKHLKTDDFFNVEKFPKMTFESTSLKKLDDTRYELSGKLTIRDVTKDVKFDVVYGGTAKDKAGFMATTTINRLDYNVKYDPTGTGVAKDIQIVLNLQFAKAK